MFAPRYQFGTSVVNRQIWSGPRRSAEREQRPDADKPHTSGGPWCRAISPLCDLPALTSMSPRRARPLGLGGAAHFGELISGASQNDCGTLPRRYRQQTAVIGLVTCL